MEEESATKQPLINEKIHCLDKEISQLFELINVLEARLNPILSIKLPPKPKEELFEPTTSPISPIMISSLLQIELNRICGLREQIEGIQKRLEI